MIRQSLGKATGARVAIVMVTLDSDSSTQMLLDTAERAGYELAVVVDCGRSSIVEDRPGLKSMAVCVIRPGKNIGYGPGCNLGATHAIQKGASILVFANPDVECDSTTLRELASRCRIGELLAPSLRRPGGRVFCGGVIRPWSGATAAISEGDIAWVSTAMVALAADDWRMVGGFDPRFFIYWDDVDLSTRLVDNGCRLRVDRSLEVTHVGRGSQPGRRGENFYAFLNCRNRLLYARKHVKSPLSACTWMLGSMTYMFLVADMRRRGRTVRAMSCIAGTAIGLADATVRGRWGPPPKLLLKRR